VQSPWVASDGTQIFYDFDGAGRLFSMLLLLFKMPFIDATFAVNLSPQNFPVNP